VETFVMQCAVYVDFDGTIAPDEPTDALFDKFADPAWRQIEKDWQEGRASSRDCMERQVALLRATPERIDRFLARVEIDPMFPAFVRLCGRHGARVIVVSDGLDRVVGHVLRAAGLELPYFANRLVWKGGERWSLQFPYYRDDCRATMGNCKCAHRREGASTLEITVGDGRSDFCMAERSKVVLAKGQLAAHCTRMGVPHLQIENFSDATRLIGRWFDSARQTYSSAAERLA
jgi:HAD superfamily phosphoserine phosphatase-like hydrolase